MNVIDRPTFISQLPFPASMLRIHFAKLSITQSKAYPHTMPPPDTILDAEDEYASEEDSDFAPEDGVANESSVSDDDGDVPDDKPTSAKRKRPTAGPEAEDAGFENSGDEAIIEKGKKRQKKSKTKDKTTEADDDAADGPLIKTRSMRAVEYGRQL